MANNDYANMDWDTLYGLRLQNRDPQFQQQIAPYEHRAFAREQVAANPSLAPVYAVAIPGYQAFKSLFGTSRTPASMSQIGQGLLGVGEGLGTAAAQRIDSDRQGLLNLIQQLSK